MPARIDVSKELDACVQSIGGVLLDDKHGPSDPVKADYWFPEENVIGELKCLSENLFDDNQFREWLNRKYHEWVKRNLMTPIAGRTVVNLAQLPLVCANEVTSFLRNKLDGNLKQANSQIRNTRKTLGAESALGLLIIVNDGNPAFPPGMVKNIVARSLPNKFSGINSIVHFTANMPCDLARIDKDVLFWCNWNVGKIRPPVPSGFIDRLRTAWISHHSRVIGEEIPAIDASQDEVYRMEFQA